MLFFLQYYQGNTCLPSKADHKGLFCIFLGQEQQSSCTAKVWSTVRGKARLLELEAVGPVTSVSETESNKCMLMLSSLYFIQFRIPCQKNSPTPVKMGIMGIIHQLTQSRKSPTSLAEACLLCDSRFYHTENTSCHSHLSVDSSILAGNQHRSLVLF